MDAAVWTALRHLYGIDLGHGLEDGYLHSDDQIPEWMLELNGAVH